MDARYLLGVQEWNPFANRDEKAHWMWIFGSSAVGEGCPLNYKATPTIFFVISVILVLILYFLFQNQ